jgi:hypothetical protein
MKAKILVLVICLTLIAIVSSFAIAEEKNKRGLEITFWKCKSNSKIIITIAPMKPSDWNSNYFTNETVMGEIFLEYDGSRLPWSDDSIFESFLKERAKQLEANYIQVEEFVVRLRFKGDHSLAKRRIS